jgi:hypothetical protein
MSLSPNRVRSIALHDAMQSTPSIYGSAKPISESFAHMNRSIDTIGLLLPAGA